MVHSFKNLLSTIALAFFILLAVASSQAKKMSFTSAGGQVPPEFNTFKDTLLVIIHPEQLAYDHYLRKNFRENYTGIYKLISKKDIENYSADKYRYVFDNHVNYISTTTFTSTPVTAGGRIRNGSSIITSDTSPDASSGSYAIRDRKLKKDYATPSSPKYSELMRAYIKALDEYRKN